MWFNTKDNALSGLLEKKGYSNKEYIKLAKKQKTLNDAWNNTNDIRILIEIIEQIGFNKKEIILFACWCVRNTPLEDGRKVWDLLEDQRSKEAIEITEQYIVGNATLDELQVASNAAHAFAASCAAFATSCAASDAASNAAHAFAAFAASNAASCAAIHKAAFHAAFAASAASNAASCAASHDVAFHAAFNICQKIQADKLREMISLKEDNKKKGCSKNIKILDILEGTFITLPETLEITFGDTSDELKKCLQYIEYYTITTNKYNLVYSLDINKIKTNSLFEIQP